MTNARALPSIAEMREILRPFCLRYRVERLEVFGSVARGTASEGSDIDLLVSLGDGNTDVAEVLEMAGEVEELLGASVDFVLRECLDSSPHRSSRAEILGSAVCLYAA